MQNKPVPGRSYRLPELLSLNHAETHPTLRLHVWNIGRFLFNVSWSHCTHEQLLAAPRWCDTRWKCVEALSVHPFPMFDLLLVDGRRLVEASPGPHGAFYLCPVGLPRS